jgi:hypothetical protein
MVLWAMHDLASGQQLLWEPFAAMTEELMVPALDLLFTMLGAPFGA